MTKWTLEFNEQALKELKKLDKPVQKQIFNYLQHRVAESGNPRLLGKPLKGNLKEFWSYRIGNYRAICSLEDDIYTVLTVRIAHRREVYE